MTRNFKFRKGSLRKDVYDFVKTKKSLTVYDVYKEFPNEKKSSLRGLLSTFATIGILSIRRGYDVN